MTAFRAVRSATLTFAFVTAIASAQQVILNSGKSRARQKEASRRSKTSRSPRRLLVNYAGVRPSP
jgi:hypothetical protein